MRVYVHAKNECKVKVININKIKCAKIEIYK